MMFQFKNVARHVHKIHVSTLYSQYDNDRLSFYWIPCYKKLRFWHGFDKHMLVPSEEKHVCPKKVF